MRGVRLIEHGFCLSTRGGGKWREEGGRERCRHPADQEKERGLEAT